MRRRPLALATTLALLCQNAALRAADEARFFGACDASAACALDAETVVVGDDETNILRLYSLAKPGMPLAEFPMGRFLKTNLDKRPEADFEACTRVGDRIYWIGSHGRSTKGKWRANRYLFFATRVIREEDGKLRIEPDGRPSRAFLEVLLGLPGLELRRAVGEVGADAPGSLAPKEMGLNIEGMAASPDGETLLIAFRNPRPLGRALLLPLTNPAAVVEDSALPEFGEPVTLDLGGRGVRSIEYSAAHGRYFIIGGSHQGADVSALYSWDGQPASQPVLIRAFDDFNPEAIAPLPGGKRVQLFSDDGTVMYKVAPGESTEDLDAQGRCECKSLIDPRKKSFRGLAVEVE